MKKQPVGFSLVELLIAFPIVLTAGMMTFQLFRENERVIRDQNLIMEMQQTARVVASQIADEVRMAGQGVPLYASRFDSTASEGVAVILASSVAGRGLAASQPARRSRLAAAIRSNGTRRPSSRPVAACAGIRSSGAGPHDTGPAARSSVRRLRGGPAG